MINILILLGRSCVGKDSVFKELTSNFGYKKMITSTTRPMRENEQQDIDYHFITKDSFIRKYIDGLFLEARYYDTKDGMWMYGSPLEDYQNADEDTVVILTIDGLKKVRENGIQCTAILIDVVDEEIKARQKIRGDDPEEAERRFLSDKRDFENAESICDFVIYNNKDIEKVAKEIDIIHRNWRYQE